MGVSASECSYLILSLFRFGLISEEQKKLRLMELWRVHEIGLDQRGLTWAAQFSSLGRRIAMDGWDLFVRQNGVTGLCCFRRLRFEFLMLL